MTDAAVATPGTSADYVVRLTASEGTVDNANNRSYVYCDLDLVTTAANGAGGAFNFNAGTTAFVNGDLGTIISYSGTYDMRPASSLPVKSLGHWEGWVTHGDDGKKTLNFGFGFSGQGGTPLGNSSPNPQSASLVLTDIPRGPYVGVGGVAKQALVYVGVGGVAKLAQMYVGVGGVAKLVG